MTVTQHFHFTHAGEMPGTTQPSISLQIKQLVDNLGVALFEQIGQRICLLDMAIASLQSVTLEREAGWLMVLDVASMSLRCTRHLVHRLEKRFSCVTEVFWSFILQEPRCHMAGVASDPSPPAQRRHTVN